MVKVDSRCPVCGEGIMKLVIDTEELSSHVIKTGLRARCTECGHEDTAHVTR
jgi:uncharacterized Zn finger protein